MMSTDLRLHHDRTDLVKVLSNFDAKLGHAVIPGVNAL